MSTNYLTRDAILTVQDVKFEDVEVPEWGGTVKVRSLSGLERDALEISVMKTNKKGDREFNSTNLRAKLVVLAVVDEYNNRLFTEADVAALGTKSASALDRVYEAATKLSRMTKADEDELAKNSLDDPNGGLHIS